MSKPKPTDYCKCPICKKVFPYSQMVDYTDTTHNNSRLEGNHIMYTVNSNTIKLCKDCENKLSTDSFWVKFLTVVFIAALILGGLLLKNVSEAFSLVLLIPGVLMIISVVIFRSYAMYELVGNLFNIKWRLSDYNVF